VHPRAKGVEDARDANVDEALGLVRHRRRLGDTLACKSRDATTTPRLVSAVHGSSA
jgi:hypothetical protein